MKYALISALCMSFSVSAFADGWECYEKNEGPLVAKVYNHTKVKTRTAAILILSDRYVEEGRRTIATFSDWAQTLSSEGASYVATVDKRRKEIRDGELIQRDDGEGARLGNVDTITLDVNYSYDEGWVRDGLRRTGTLTAVKRDGDSFEIKMNCYRYSVE